jgi:hypothetical protein
VAFALVSPPESVFRSDSRLRRLRKLLILGIETALASLVWRKLANQLQHGRPESQPCNLTRYSPAQSSPTAEELPAAACFQMLLKCGSVEVPYLLHSLLRRLRSASVNARSARCNLALAQNWFAAMSHDI